MVSGNASHWCYILRVSLHLPAGITTGCELILQGALAQEAFFSETFPFEDADDLRDAPFRDFPSQLYCLVYQDFRYLAGTGCLRCLRLQTFKSGHMVVVHPPADRPFRDAVLYAGCFLKFLSLRFVQGGIHKR